MNKATKLLLGLSLATSTVIGSPKFDKKNDIKHSASTELFESIQANTVKDSIDYQAMLTKDTRKMLKEYGEQKRLEIIRHCILSEMNKERKQPLQIDDRLNYAADEYAYDAQKNNIHGHIGKDGSTPVTRAKMAGYKCKPDDIKENVARDYYTIQGAMDFRRGSTVHYKNMKNKNITHVGIGYYGGYRVVIFGGKEDTKE